MGRSGAAIVKRCGCRDRRTGKQAGQRCPLLPRPGHGSWYLTAELPAGPDGQWRRVRIGGYPTRAGAETALARLRAPSGPASAAAGWTTGQWLETWLAGRQSLRPSTRRGYRQHLDCYLIPAVGQVPLVMLTAADLRGACYHVMAITGLRRGEAAGLRWTDIDFGAATSPSADNSSTMAGS